VRGSSVVLLRSRRINWYRLVNPLKSIDDEVVDPTITTYRETFR
jgi:hypothetical protein